MEKEFYAQVVTQQEGTSLPASSKYVTMSMNESSFILQNNPFVEGDEIRFVRFGSFVPEKPYYVKEVSGANFVISECTELTPEHKYKIIKN